MEKIIYQGFSKIYCLLNIVKIIKSNRVKRAGYVEHTGKKITYTKFYRRSLNERDHLEEASMDGITFKWILKKWRGKAWTGYRKNDCGKLLQTWHSTFGLHHMQRNS